MSYRFFTVAALISVIGIIQVSAQPEIQPADGKVLISLTLSPADVRRPVSRDNLIPEFREMIQGNRVQMFLRCFMEQDNLFGRAESEKRQKWNEMPLKDLPFEDLKNYAGRLVERDMYDAARMTQVDWQLWYFMRRDGFMTLLPDVQKMRALAEVLRTRVRGQIAAKEFDGALHTLKIIFGLGRTMESHPCLIGHLVGTAISMIGVSALEELIQQPGCPNLFWALTDLPTPFLSMRPGIEGERTFVSHDYESLKTASDPVVDTVIMKKIEAFEEYFGFIEPQEGARPERGAFTTSIETRAKNADEVKAARERLAAAGLNADRVKIWSPLHVVFLDDVMLYERYRDEVYKWMNLPFWIAKPGMDASLVEWKKVRDKSPILTLVPRSLNVKQAQARLDQRLAYLQIIEGIRLYAHENKGKLPPSLQHLKLPLLPDPVTGKPFEYMLVDDKATLHGEIAIPANVRTNRYYEIRMRK